MTSAGRSVIVPLIIRGEIIQSDLVTFPARHGGVTFATPNVRRYAHRLPLANPSDLRDYYEISLDDIVDFLVALGARLDFRKNPYLQECFELSVSASGLTARILRHMFEKGLPRMFRRAQLEEIVDRNIGREYLEGWVRVPLLSGAVGEVRAFGARGVHIVPGNAVLAAGVTVIRCASRAATQSLSRPPTIR